MGYIPNKCIALDRSCHHHSLNTGLRAPQARSLTRKLQRSRKAGEPQHSPEMLRPQHALSVRFDVWCGDPSLVCLKAEVVEALRGGALDGEAKLSDPVRLVRVVRTARSMVWASSRAFPLQTLQATATTSRRFRRGRGRRAAQGVLTAHDVFIFGSESRRGVSAANNQQQYGGYTK